MRFWRIAKRRYALDKSCDGNRTAGEKWNAPGVGALYAAETIELAALEQFVHSAGLPLNDLVLVDVDAPDETALVHRIQVTDLPTGWNGLPASGVAHTLGTDWLNKAQQRCLLGRASVPNLQGIF